MQVRAFLQGKRQRHVKGTLWRRVKVGGHVCNFSSFGACSAGRLNHSLPALAVLIFCHRDREEVCKALAGSSEFQMSGVVDACASRECSIPSETRTSIGMFVSAKWPKFHDGMKICLRTYKYAVIIIMNSKTSCSVTVWGILLQNLSRGLQAESSSRRREYRTCPSFYLNIIPEASSLPLRS
jgi:hypothetical protein